MGEIFNNLMMGFGQVLNLQSILWILIGVCVGILGGAIPGISPSMAVALLLPMTYAMSPTVALIMLMGIYIGANYGGSITAVAINTPGTPAEKGPGGRGHGHQPVGVGVRRRAEYLHSHVLLGAPV